MKGKLLVGAVLSLVTFGLMTGSVFAWSFMVNGAGSCQSDGSFNIVWTIKNDYKPTTFTVTQSSDTSVVPDGTTIAGGATATFPQTVNGTAGDTFKLTITGHWPKGEDEGFVTKTETASVVLDGACTQPVTPPVTPPATPQVLGASTTQVTPPAGPVNAGTAASFGFDSAAILGATGSVGLVGFGLRRRMTHKV